MMNINYQYPYQTDLANLTEIYGGPAGISGIARLRQFVVEVIRSGNVFSPDDFKPYAYKFGLKATSISAAFDVLLKEGTVSNNGPAVFNKQFGKKNPLTWWVN
ncbi:hypothetical protein ACQKTA_07250 [Enterococcus sp. 22-H-5-01]|uniref:hypothetical protein n=1 Tax=Enterococcus sp. 22-H-5-01 TaxID=3418555 RepID=UPI003D093BA3